MIQADMMKNKPLVPSALEPLKCRISPNYRAKKTAMRRSNEMRELKAQAAIMIARSDVNSLLI